MLHPLKHLRFYLYFSAAYVLLGLIAYASSPGEVIPPIFLPLALTVACLFLYGYKTIPGVALGSVLLIASVGFDPLQIFTFSIFETAMAGLIGFVIVQSMQGSAPSEDPKMAILFASVTMLLVWPIYAGLGAFLICIFSGNFDEFLSLFIRWWQGDTLTLFLASSFATLLSGKEFKPGSPSYIQKLVFAAIPSLMAVSFFGFWSLGKVTLPAHLMLATTCIIYFLMIKARSLSLFCLSTTIIALWANYVNGLELGPLASFDGSFWVFAAMILGAGPGWFIIIILKRHDIEIEQQAARAERAQVETSSTKKVLFEALNRLSLTRDNETGNHILRTQHYVRAIARQLKKLSSDDNQGLDDAYVDAIFLAAPLHDIGKVGIPDAILLKPGSLSDEEWETMKTHALIGESVLTSAGDHIQSRELAVASEVAGGHHEKWDGSGYPRGLRGEDIPLSARIMAIADVYDALTTKRVYKNAWTHEQAMCEIKRLEGIQFDPRVTTAFFNIEDEVIAISKEFSD